MDHLPATGSPTSEKVTPAFVSAYISDLFFNTDLRSAMLPFDSQGYFQGFDDERLKEEAEIFLHCLDRLGVDVPAPEDLIANFYRRI